MKKQLKLLIFKDDDWWVAQCLDYDIAAQARTLTDIQYEIQRVLVGRIVMAQKLKVDPFEGISPAPEVYFKMLNDKRKVFKLELKPVTRFVNKIISQYFMFPKQAMLCET